MAYVSKEKKAKIAAALKAVMPEGWKYSLRVENHTAIRMMISAAPFDIIQSYSGKDNLTSAYIQVNEFHLAASWAEPVLSVLKKAAEALNTDNFDNSDPMTDYFHVGHYVHLHIGAWDKPFQVVPLKSKPRKAKAEKVEAKPAEETPAKESEVFKPIEFPTFTAADTIIHPVEHNKPEPAPEYADLMTSFISTLG